MEFDESHDFVIVGSGGGAATAALVIKAAGKSPLILEKQSLYGGSTAFSGGVLWIPNNTYLESRNSVDQAMLYLDTLVGDPGPGSTRAKRLAYVTHGRAMLRFLQGLGMEFRHAYWPDYYSDLPGGLDEGRSLVAPPFDINKLGGWAPKLARFEGWPDVPVGSEQFANLSLAKRTWRGRAAAARIGWRLMLRKIARKHLRASGNALQGRMLEIVLREDVATRLPCPVVELISKNDRVVGVVTEHEGRRMAIGARAGVLLNAGGFSRNPGMRAQYQPKSLNPNWALANPGDTGEMIRAAMQLGAATDFMNESWWCPSSTNEDGTFRAFHIPTDVAKPHVIIVDKSGNRIGNEANSYMEFGQRMLAAGAVPAWAIIESRHRARYPWGVLAPGHTPSSAIDTGYLRKAETIEALALACGIDVQGLTSTVRRFNGFAQAGRDDDFHRGDTAYNNYNGDPRHHPNPNLGSIEEPPYYACALYPADVGTAGGLVTDEHGRVLRDDGTVISGLFAGGNSAASVFGRFYPGAGASIGHSFVFGYIAARHALGANH